MPPKGCHQVQLARPAVPQPQGAHGGALCVERHPLVRDRLLDRIVQKELHVHRILGEGTRRDPLVAVELRHVLDEALDDEQAARLQDPSPTLRKQSTWRC